MKNLPITDLLVILLYLLAMVWIGIYFSRKNKNAQEFSTAAGSIPGWAIGFSIFATFLSSNTFLGVPGKAFGSNWNSFVFSISMPFAAWFAARYFVPFYRKSGYISAYEHFENRFGPWARTYMVVCFLLTQLARMGSIFFGIGLSLQALLGFSLSSIMIVMGICIIIYTVMGGMAAVIWTEVVQAIVLSVGALLILLLMVADIPGGAGTIIDIGIANDKFSLGSFALGLDQPTFWVILLYGFFINLNNFGIDQNYVQRYHTATSQKQAAGSVWLCVVLYVPVSLLFFVIGSSLFAYYEVYPDAIATVKEQVVQEMAHAGTVVTADQLTAADYGDKVMPHFIVSRIPAGLAGLIVSAILSAAMSTISSGMNASGTVFTADILKRYFKRNMNERQQLRALHIATAAFGLLGLGTGIAMIGAKSLLDMWWELSGIFAGGMLGLFLLSMISRRTTGHAALTATLIGVLVILWMTFSGRIPEAYAFLRSPFHVNMIIVIGTLTIFLVGLLLSASRKPWSGQENPTA